ncbi:hypothetical protein JCM19045_746 [Bacillus sp. JCM 19045]|nr:hypothetical protein JCM19045_746 [Bacillus sp. JCM 19045]
MGNSPQIYIRKLRMERAKALLLQTDHSIALIGREVGIPNQPYFTTLFQKETGQSPTAFRKKGTE